MFIKAAAGVIVAPGGRPRRRRSARARAHSRAANGRIVFQRGAPYDGGSSSLYLINRTEPGSCG